MADNNKKRKTLLGMVEEGQILKEFGSDTFISVNPKPDIDKIEVQIVKQETKGQDYVNFWLTTQQMFMLCTEICNGVFQKKCLQDVNSNYPEAYKYVSGKDGSKELKFGGGKKGYRFNIQNKADNKYKNVGGVTFEAIRMMAELFFIIYGFKPADYYMKSLADKFWKHNSNASKHYNISDEDEDYTEDNTESTTDSPEKETVASNKSNKTTSDNTTVANNNNAANTVNNTDEEPRLINSTVFVIKGSFKDYANGKSFEALNCENGNPGNKKAKIMIINGHTNVSDEEYNSLKEFSSTNELTKVEISYYVKDNNCYLMNL